MTLHRSGIGLLLLSFAVWTQASDVAKTIPSKLQLTIPELGPTATFVTPLLVSQVRSCPQGRGRCGR
jgi:hypothetical protein